MPAQPDRKFISLHNQPALKLQSLKQKAILSIKQAEKAANNLKEKLKIAQDFLTTHPDLTVKTRQKLDISIQEGTNAVSQYQAEIVKIKRRLVVALKKSGSL